MIRMFFGAIATIALLPAAIWITASAWERTLWHVAEWLHIVSSTPAAEYYAIQLDGWADSTFYIVTFPLAFLLMPVLYFVPPILLFCAVRGIWRQTRPSTASANGAGTGSRRGTGQ